MALVVGCSWIWSWIRGIDVVGGCGSGGGAGEDD